MHEDNADYAHKEYNAVDSNDDNDSSSPYTDEYKEATIEESNCSAEETDRWPARGHHNLHYETPRNTASQIRPSQGHPKYDGSEQQGFGIRGLMKAFMGEPCLSGADDENFDNFLSIMYKLSNMCSFNFEQNCQAVPVMIKCDSLGLFSQIGESCHTYEQASILPRNWYNWSGIYSAKVWTYQACKATSRTALVNRGSNYRNGS